MITKLLILVLQVQVLFLSWLFHAIEQIQKWYGRKRFQHMIWSHKFRKKRRKLFAGIFRCRMWTHHRWEKSASWSGVYEWCANGCDAPWRWLERSKFTPLKKDQE